MRKKSKRIICIIIALVLVFTACFVTYQIKYNGYLIETDAFGALEYLKDVKIPDWVDVQLIHVHNTARTGMPTRRIKNIVIHYVGNPNSTAQNNRNYFDKSSTGVSSHFIVGLEGEVIQCVPLWERSAASNWRNKDTISIEVCHPDQTGKFNPQTYDSVVKLTAFLCKELKLDKDDVIRHYDITGKHCPLYYVEHEDKWEDLKEDVEERMGDYR